MLKVKYKFYEFPRILLTSKGELWQESYESYGRNYGFRQVKETYHQGQLKYRINGKWITKKRLNESAYRVDEYVDNGQLPNKLLPF